MYWYSAYMLETCFQARGKKQYMYKSLQLLCILWLYLVIRCTLTKKAKYYLKMIRFRYANVSLNDSVKLAIFKNKGSLFQTI